MPDGWRLTPAPVGSPSRVTSSSPWDGWDSAAILAIASALLRSSEPTWPAYAVMEMLGTRTLPGFALGATLTGLLLSIGTRWGIVRHGWVAAKLVIAVVVAVTGAMVAAPLLDTLADASADGSADGSGRPLALLLSSGLAWVDTLGVACHLEAQRPDTVAWYARHGFEVHATSVLLTGGHPNWSMRRAGMAS